MRRKRSSRRLRSGAPIWSRSDRMAAVDLVASCSARSHMQSRHTRTVPSRLFVNRFWRRGSMNIGKLKDADALEVLREGSLGRLGCIAAGWPYVVPVNYYFDGRDIYIHSLPGKKLDALRVNPRVCLQADEIKDSYNWRS